MKKSYKYLLLIISLLLSSCNEESIYFNYEEMIDKVVKIEVVETEASGQPAKYNKHLLSLDDDLIDDFLLDLSKIEFIRPCMICNLSFPDGITFLIYYENYKVDYDYIDYAMSTYNGNFVVITGPNDIYYNLVDKYYYQII